MQLTSLKRKRVEQTFFLFKKTRLAQKNCILRILKGDKIQTFRFFSTTSSESIDTEIRKAFGMKPPDECYYFLFNEKNHQVPLVPSCFPDDFNLRLEELVIPKTGYTMRETFAWKHLSQQIALGTRSFSSSLCDLIAEYGLNSLFYVGSKVDMYCNYDGKYWVGTIVNKTPIHLAIKYDGWALGYQRQRPLDLQERKEGWLFLNEKLEIAGSYTGNAGVKARTRYVKPWQCSVCQVWCASHLVRCTTTFCSGFRPVSEERWCSIHTNSPKDHCIECEWMCLKCNFINEPYFRRCEYCDGTDNPHWCYGLILRHRA
jgi:hypothetical protein